MNDLLELQKIDARRSALRYAAVDLAALARRAASYFEAAAHERGIALTVDVPERLPAHADPDRLQRVLVNLLGNALEFTPERGRVRLALAELGEEWVRIDVHDSGPGVPERDRELVFEPFRQGESRAERRLGGTGLGLAIVREFVRLHGGRVSVGDSPEGGALFTVELPLRAPAGAEVAAESEPRGLPPVAARVPAPVPTARPPRRAAGAGDRPLVLVVEDNPEMNRFVSDALAGAFRVESAFDGREGLEKARALVPDLILSDVMMPEMGGDELLRVVRETPRLGGVPVLLLTARADEALRVRLLAEGAQDYLVKPFSVEELRTRVGNWVRAKRARDLLRDELASTQQDLEALARDVVGQKRKVESALAAARVALDEAEAANRAKADFLGVISHELRTPLNAVVGYVDLLDAGIGGPVNPPQREHLRRVRVSAEHLREIIDGILTYTRAEAGKAPIEPRPVELGELLRETAALLEPEAAARGLALRVRVPEHPVAAETDPGKLRQVVLALLSNAVKFTEAGEVVAELETDAGGAVLRVRDTGVGIAPEHHGRVFEAFWQVDSSTTRRTGGTGLGLALARTLLGLLGGTVEVESAPGQGSTFTVRLPLRHPASAPARAGEAPA